MTQKKPRSLSRVIFLKELKETLRDRRVILGVLVSPLLLTPLLIGVIGYFAGQKEIRNQTATQSIGLYAEAPFAELVSYLEENEGLKLRAFESREALESSILERKTRAGLVIGADAAATFSDNGSAPVEILFNVANERSQNAKSRLRKTLQAFKKEAVERRLAAKELPASLIQPLAIKESNLSQDEALGGFVLSMVLPYLVVMGAAFGGINTAFDLCAGEKERGTMETLLVSPASRQQIVRGKLATIVTISVMAAICSVLGILIVMVSGTTLFQEQLQNALTFSYVHLAALALIVVPLSLLTSSGLLVISSFARNQKEAQAYIFPFVALVILPAVLSSILGAESPLYTAFIPVLNIALTMKQLLGSVFDLSYFCISLASSFAYAALAMRAATALFQRESILFRA